MKKPEPRQVYDYDDMSDYLYAKYYESYLDNPSLYYFDYYFDDDDQTAWPFVIVDFQEVVNTPKDHSEGIVKFAKIVLEEFKPKDGIMVFV